MMQDIIAPFVLENLNCTGTEARLVDCPGAGATEAEYTDYRYLYQFTGGSLGGCDPVADFPAAVSCGTLTGPGVISRRQCAVRLIQCHN